MEKISENKVTFLILAGKKKNMCGPARQVHRVKEAMVSDMLEKLALTEQVDRIIVSSNDGDFLDRVKDQDPRIVIDKFEDRGDFHFGRWLFERIERYQPSNLFYWGAGASPFITREIIESICTSIIEGENILYTNNFFSADWVAFTPAKTALSMEPPPMDNNLAYHLWQHRALRSIYIAPSVEIVGDVDTPADLPILAVHPHTGSHARKVLESLNPDTSRVERFCSLLKERNHIFMAGRVGSSLFKYLDTNCPCSFRILSEERGMRSFGRLKKRQVRSILGTMVDAMGTRGVLDFIGEMCDGAVIDTRVLFAHRLGRVGTRDRFYSDLFEPDKIKEPFVAEFTREVMNAKIPVLLGGHSLILGGTWAMVSAFGQLPFFY